MTTATERTGATGGRNATVITVRVLGVLAASTGIEHGLGEIRQGSVAPPAVVFESWPDVAAFDPLNGEPAMSLIPNLLVSGVASVLVALALGAVACRHPHRSYSKRLLLGLSLLLLLVGGGFGPPLLGVLTGLLATRIDVRPARLPGPATRLAARAWPWPLLVATASFLGLVPGTALLHTATGGDISALVAVLTVTAFTATALAIWTARARDRLAGTCEPARPHTATTHEDHDRADTHPTRKEVR